MLVKLANEFNSASKACVQICSCLVMRRARQRSSGVEAERMTSSVRIGSRPFLPSTMRTRLGRRRGWA